MLALQQGADPFQPHAGIDRLHIQRAHRAIFELLVLHEHNVPDFDKPVAIFLGRARRAAPNVIAVIIKDLGAGATGAGGAHLPEIIAGGDANDPVFGNTHFLPNFKGLVIGVIDRGQQAFGIDAEFFGDQLPGKGDSLGFEIIAKREIAQHFKKCVVAGGIADIIKIVMFAPCPHAFLGGGGPHIIALFDAGETVFELHHARIGKHQCRVVARHQGAGLHNLVPLRLKIRQESRADIVQRRHVRSLAFKGMEFRQMYLHTRQLSIMLWR